MKQEKIDKRAAALRENLKKRKALATENKQDKKDACCLLVVMTWKFHGSEREDDDLLLGIFIMCVGVIKQSWPWAAKIILRQGSCYMHNQ